MLTIILRNGQSDPNITGPVLTIKLKTYIRPMYSESFAFICSQPQPSLYGFCIANKMNSEN